MEKQKPGSVSSARAAGRTVTRSTAVAPELLRAGEPVTNAGTPAPTMRAIGAWHAVLAILAVVGVLSLWAAGAVAQTVAGVEGARSGDGAPGRPGAFGANQPPNAFFEYSPSPATVEVPVGFNAAESFDPDGSVSKYEWDFDGDGKVDAVGMSTVWMFDEPGTYLVTLRVEDNQGAAATLTRRVVVQSRGLNVSAIEARFSYAPAVPLPGQQVIFDAGDSVVDAPPATYRWDFNEDGRFDAFGRRVTRRFVQTGPHAVTLEVADAMGRMARLTRVVHVGERHATLTIESEPENLTVYIDGVERGRTPLTVELDRELVHVRVRHHWLGEWEANIDLSYTSTLKIFVELR